MLSVLQAATTEASKKEKMSGAEPEKKSAWRNPNSSKLLMTIMAKHKSKGRSALPRQLALCLESANGGITVSHAPPPSGAIAFHSCRPAHKRANRFVAPRVIMAGRAIAKAVAF